MIAADPKNAPSAEEVEIAVAGAIEQILALASTKADVEAERLQHAHHHLVQMLRVQAIALRFPLGQHGADVEAPAAPVGFRLVTLRVSHIRRLVRATTSEVFSGIFAPLTPLRPTPPRSSYQFASLNQSHTNRGAQENLVQMRALTSQLNQR